MKFIGAKSFKMLTPNETRYENSELLINNFSISGSELILSGEIDNKKFNLLGTIYQSRIHDEKLLIDSKDIEGNFEVIHTGIFLKLPNNYNLLLNNETINENIFLLYLKNDDIYYTFEFEIPKEIIKEISQSVYKDYDDKLLSIEHWEKH